MNCNHCKTPGAPHELIDGLCHHCTTAACAEMRGALSLIKAEAVRCSTEVQEVGHTEFRFTVGMSAAVNDALAGTAGQGWASPAEVEKLKAERNAAAVEARHKPLKRVAALAAERDQLQAQVADLEKARSKWDAAFKEWVNKTTPVEASELSRTIAAANLCPAHVGVKQERCPVCEVGERSGAAIIQRIRQFKGFTNWWENISDEDQKSIIAELEKPHDPNDTTTIIGGKSYQ